jgi:hypothetical protein
MIFSARDLNNFHAEVCSLSEAFNSLGVLNDGFALIPKTAIKTEAPAIDLPRFGTPRERMISAATQAIDLLSFQRFQECRLLNNLYRA